MNKKNSELDFLTGGDEVGAMMRQHDWSTSPLGPPETWPQSLRSVVGLLLNSKFPMFVAWGPELAFLYNDSYIDVLGEKHPQALGRRFYNIWSEIWDDISPLIDRALAGEASYRENLPLLMRRKGYDEQTWFTFSYSPVRDENGQVAGLYCSCVETTAQILNERHRAQENERLHQFFEQAPGIMAVLKEPTHIFELANNAYLQLIGHRDLIGKPAREALPEVQGQGFFELLDAVYETGKPYVGRGMPVELRRQPQGPLEKRFVDFIYQPIRDSTGQVSGIFVEGSDVTDHYHTQIELQRLNQELTDKIVQLENTERRAMQSAQQAEREQRQLDALLEAAPVGIVMADMNGKLLRVNPANKILWGEILPTAGSIGEYEEWKGWWADHSEKHGQRLQPHEWAMARALHGEEAPRHIVEIEPFGMPGVRRTIVNSGAPVRDAEGKIISAVIAQMDITDQVKAEAALRESEAKFRTITDAMPQMVWSTLPDGYHDYYNQQWYRYTGMPDGATDGDRWKDMFHPDDQARAWDAWQHSVATGEPYEIQYRLRHHSGEYRWTLGRALPIRDGFGKTIRWMGTCTDIHDQKLAEEALREADRRKDEFLAMLAHELRNPLAPISAAAELMEIASLNAAQIKETSRIISRQVRHMTGLVDDLLDVSRVTRGLVSLEKNELDIKRIVYDAAEQVRPLIESKRHHLSMELARESTHVTGDKKRLVQVLTNLLNNAAKYTPEGGNIHLKMETTEHEVILSVADNGIGIAPALQRHIFELFAQAERTSDRSQGGLGIGLALVRSLVELHGGSIACSSEGIGKGSNFTMRLPRLVKTQEVPGDQRATRTVSDTQGLRILLVDDNADAGNMLGMYLEAMGHEVIVEYGSRRALERARIEKPEVCILDIGLPDMDGNELARRLHAQSETARATLIAVTGYGQEQDKKNALAAGFAHHLVKPVDTGKLIAILSELKIP